MLKFDIAIEDLKNPQKRTSVSATHLEKYLYSPDRVLPESPFLDTLVGLDKMNHLNSAVMKSIEDLNKIYPPSFIPEPLKIYESIKDPEIHNWQEKFMKPLEEQLKAMQTLNTSLAEQNVALHTQSELIQKQLIESQKANELKEKELKDSRESKKIDNRWVIASFSVGFLTLVATLFFGYYSSNIKSQASSFYQQPNTKEDVIFSEKK